MFLKRDYVTTVEYASRPLPVVSIDDFKNPLLHLLKGNVLYVWIGRSPLLWTWGYKIIHHVLQFKEEVTFKLRPLNPDDVESNDLNDDRRKIWNFTFHLYSNNLL